MVREKMLSTYLIASLYFLILSLPVSQAQAAGVTLSLGDGAGIKGTVCCNPNYPDINRMELSLENLNDRVGVLQVDICSADLGGDLILSGWEVTPRAENLTHTITEVSSCIEVRFEWTDFGNIYIAEGSGPVLILYFDVDVFAPGGTCSDLTLNNICRTEITSSDNQKITPLCEVVWSSLTRKINENDRTISIYGIGLKFIDLTDNEKRFLEKEMQ